MFLLYISSYKPQLRLGFGFGFGLTLEEVVEGDNICGFPFLGIIDLGGP